MSLKKIKKGKGFTIVEVLVSMGISVFAIFVMTQFYSSFNKDKSRALNAGSAANNAKMALSIIEADLRSAGYGFTGNGGYDCEDAKISYAGEEQTDFSVDGIKIRDSAGYNNSDNVVIQYATGTDSIGGALLRSAYVSGTNEIYPTQVFGCKPGDLILLSSGNKCSIQQVSSVNRTGFVIGVQPNNQFNPPTSVSSTWHTYPIDGHMTCIGGYSKVEYKVENGILMKSSFPNDFVPLIDNVVAMKAQYGISETPFSKDVVQWVDANGEWANLSANERKRIRSLRIGFVMRNTEIETKDVSFPCNPEMGTGVCLWSTDDENSPPPVLDLSDQENWQRYRYTTISTIVPLRNMIWN